MGLSWAVKVSDLRSWAHAAPAEKSRKCTLMLYPLQAENSYRVILSVQKFALTWVLTAGINKRSPDSW
jgi:hypothetical protein